MKSDFDKRKKHGLSEANINAMKESTLNLAPQDWERVILSDQLTSADQQIGIMRRDYIYR